MVQNLTIRQQKLVSLLKQELLKENGSKSLAELMRLAGYSDKTAINPSAKVLNSPAVQDQMRVFTDKLQEKADLALNAITKKKLDKSTPRDNAYVNDIMIKNRQLLTGGATEKKTISIEISQEIAEKNS